MIKNPFIRRSFEHVENERQKSTKEFKKTKISKDNHLQEYKD
jgi:hypothetical protein